MERRRFPRQDVRGTPLKATLILAGGSLLKRGLPTAIEINAEPVNLSRSGVCISLGLDTTWETFLMKKEVQLLLERGKESRSLRGRIVHLKDENRTLGLEFDAPLPDFSHLLLPEELASY